MWNVNIRGAETGKGDDTACRANAAYKGRPDVQSYSSEDDRKAIGRFSY